MAERPVLLAFDGSSGSAGAIETARTLLGPRAATVVNVWSPVMAYPPVAAGIPAYLADLEPKLEEAARELAGLKSALLGSTSSGILHHTQRPVLVVHQDDAGEKP